MPFGILTRSRFAGFATAMHGVGTISAGAAIALTGQILQHAGALAFCRHAVGSVRCVRLGFAAGSVPATLTLLLLPAWILSEWMDRANDYGGVDTYMARVLAVIAGVSHRAFWYRRRAVFSILFAAGGLMLPVAVIVLSSGWSVANYGRQQGNFLPLSYRLVAVGLVLLTMTAGWFLDRKSWAPVLVVAAMAWALPWAQSNFVEKTAGRTWSHSEANVLAYALPAAAAVFLVWGVPQPRQATRQLWNGRLRPGRYVVLLCKRDGQARSRPRAHWSRHPLSRWRLGAGIYPPKDCRRHGNGSCRVKAMRAGIILALVQLVLVLSVAGKYLYERKTRPRVWTRAAQYDPSLPLRGRYVALQLMVDACGLPRGAEHTIPAFPEDIPSGAGMYPSLRRMGN